MGKGKRNKQKAATEGLKITGMVFWHGGAAGRAVGEHIVPGQQLAFRRIIDRDNDFSVMRPDFAYATTDRDLAFDFAVRESMKTGHGALYLVKPIGKITHDPDFPQGVSYRCKQAEVLDISVDGITPSTPFTRQSWRYMKWTDGSDLFDDDGYAIPNKVQRHFGVTSDDLRFLGPWSEFPLIQQAAATSFRAKNPGVSDEHVLGVAARL